MAKLIVIATSLSFEICTFYSLSWTNCICMDVRKAFLYFDPRVFVLVRLSTPSQIALNRILWFIDQYPYHPSELFTVLNSFAGAVQT